jgi:hypothetical protein
MTFCVSPDCENKCGRKLTPDIRAAADRWWGKCEGEAPIAVSCFCGGDLEEVMNQKKGSEV